MNYPFVSVLMITYNHEKFIEESINSILTQTYQNFELIIGDDASTDKTREILNDYKNKYPEKIKLILHERNIGITSNCNSVLKQAQGDFICMLGGDDVFSSTKLEKQVNYLVNHPDKIGCYHKMVAFDSDTKKHIYTYNPNRYKFKKGHEILRFGSFYHIHIHTIMVRKEYMVEFNESIPVSSDVLASALIAAKGEMGFINDVLFKYRKHKKSITALNYSNFKNALDETLLTYKIYFESTGAPEIYYKMALARQYCYYSFLKLVIDNDLSEVEDKMKLSRSYYKSGLLKGIYYLVCYKSISLLLQWAMWYSIKLNATFLIKGSYNFLKKTKIAPRITN